MARSRVIVGFLAIVGLLSFVVPGCDELITEVTEVTIAGHPTADFSADKDSGCVPETVTFIDESNGPRNRWQWDFGDGDTSTEASPTHIYDSAGTYKVTLEIFDDELEGYDREEKSRFVIVGTAVGGIEASDTLACPGTEISFKPLDYGGISTWRWNFGDGSDDSVSTDSTPTHVYDSSGVYTITLTTIGGCPQTTIYDSNLIRITDCPVSGFYAEPTTGCRPLSVQFYDTSVAPPGEVIVTRQWDFGNGRNSTTQDPTISYTTAGTFEVALTVTSDGGGSATFFDTIIVHDSTSAAFSAVGPTEGCFVPSRQFQVKFEMDSPGLIDSLLWDFGDGNIAYNDTSPVHAYYTPGRYSVTVKAFGCRTDETTIFDLVVLSDSLSPVSFSIAPDTGTIDTSTTLTFTDMSSGAAVKNWFWNFGDAEIGNDSIVAHKYADTGTYVVSLTIFNSCDSLKASDTIVVTEVPAAAPMKKARR